MVDLYTRQGEQLTGTPWQVYPRPQMRRESYVNLNGEWEFSAGGYRGKILVPFCPESHLSGVCRHFSEGTWLIYRRELVLPEDFNRGRVLLHIGAADQELKCYVNSKPMGSHQGGYTAMTFDITDALQERNTLELRVRDDLKDQSYPYGKQTLKRGGMWYTPVSGIWQTVWLESVPENYIQKLTVENRGESVTVSVAPALEGKVILGEKVYPLEAGKVTIAPEDPHLWSPEDPYLYDFAVETAEDRVESYFALRKLESKVINGIPRLCLNGKPYFFHGLLDQGYWPDGIYTPASPENYAEDILAMKNLGFNTLRKHIKVEPEEFYYQCDKLGMVVFQDMVNNGDYSFFRDTALPTLGIQAWPDKGMHPDPNARSRFLQTMEETVEQLKNHPSILYWTIFNEAWGQFDSATAYEKLKQLDDIRWIDSTSGWFRGKRTDVKSLHIYFDLWHRLKGGKQPLVLSEFGGFTYPEEGHIFNPDNAYGYKTCKSREELTEAVEQLYRQRVLPGIKKGLCAAIYTQVSDVEDEINGLLTYDRKVCKADPERMQKIAQDLHKAIIE